MKEKFKYIYNKVIEFIAFLIYFTVGSLLAIAFGRFMGEVGEYIMSLFK